MCYENKRLCCDVSIRYFDTFEDLFEDPDQHYYQNIPQNFRLRTQLEPCMGPGGEGFKTCQLEKATQVFCSSTEVPEQISHSLENLLNLE